MYGQRIGAMIGITSNADVAKEFVDVNQYTSRATWSNSNSAAMASPVNKVITELNAGKTVTPQDWEKAIEDSLK